MSLIASLVLCAAAPAPVVDPALKKMAAEQLVPKIFTTRGQAQRDVMDELVRRGPEADRVLLLEMGRHNATIQLIYAQKGAPAIPRLIPMLKDPALLHAAGNALIQASSHRARAHAAALLACVKDLPAYQYCGIALTRTMSTESAAFAPKLVKELANKNALVRMFAATALGEIGYAGAAVATMPLSERLGDVDPNVTWAAARALGKIGRAAALAVPALEQAAKAHDHELQRVAQEALNNIRG